MADDSARKRFRRRLRLAAVLGFLSGLVVCLDLEARDPTDRSPFAWERPSSVAAAVPGGSELGGVLYADEVVPAESGPAVTPEEALAPSLDLAAAKVRNGALVQALPDGHEVEFTLDPKAQVKLTELLRKNKVAFGAVVALDPKTGDVLAYVEVDGGPEPYQGLAHRALAPSASVFKVITSAALIESGGVNPKKKVCFHGGLHGISEEHIVDNPKRDTRCETLGEALARSRNPVFGKLADRTLDAATLQRTAEAFGYGSPVPFVLPTEASPVAIPAERVEKARAAAGFWHSQLSVLHGALIAAGVANGGEIMRPRLLRAVRAGDGSTAMELSPPAPWRRAVQEETAKTLGRMMEGTVEFGTAARHFRARPKHLKGMRIAGKTGSLSAKNPEQLHFSWFVGFAPAEDPKVAVAVLVVNRPLWHIKAPFVAKEALALLLAPPAAAGKK